MKISVPSSRNGRKVSCCALLKRCTSSRNRIVRRFATLARFLRLLHRRADVLHARHHRRQRDELAHPRAARSGARAWSCRCRAGPRGSSNAAGRPRSPAAAACPAPRTCCCPTNSSSERGRMRSASGRRSSADVARGLPCGNCLRFAQVWRHEAALDHGHPVAEPA